MYFILLYKRKPPSRWHRILCCHFRFPMILISSHLTAWLFLTMFYVNNNWTLRKLFPIAIAFEFAFPPCMEMASFSLFLKAKFNVSSEERINELLTCNRKEISRMLQNTWTKPILFHLDVNRLTLPQAARNSCEVRMTFFFRFHNFSPMCAAFFFLFLSCRTFWQSRVMNHTLT